MVWLIAAYILYLPVNSDLYPLPLCFLPSKTGATKLSPKSSRWINYSKMRWYIFGGPRIRNTFLLFVLTRLAAKSFRQSYRTRRFRLSPALFQTQEVNRETKTSRNRLGEKGYMIRVWYLQTIRFHFATAVPF